MENVVSSFFQKGIDDEVKYGKKFTSSTLELYPMYRLGRLEERYKNCPTKKQLLEELSEQLEKYDFSPNIIGLYVRNKYSHRLLRRVLLAMGYRIPSFPVVLIPNRFFHAWRIR